VKGHGRPAAASAARVDALLELGRLDAAIESAKKALELSPSDINLLCRLAFAYYRTAEAEACVEAAEAAIAVDPVSEWAHRLRALGLLDLPGMSDEAVLSAEEALSLRPTVQGWLTLGEIRTARREWEQAELALGNALRAQPDRSGTHNAIGVLRARQRRWSEAEDHFKRAIALNPSSERPWVDLGIMHHDMGEFTQALLCFETASQMNPGGGAPASVAFSLASLAFESLFSKSDPVEKKIARCEEALELAGPSSGARPFILLRLGQLLQGARGDSQDYAKRSISVLELALELKGSLDPSTSFKSMKIAEVGEADPRKKAILLFEAAAALAPEFLLRRLWGQTTLSLAHAHLRLNDQAGSDRAISELNGVLNDLTPERDADLWVRCKLALGVAYMQLTRGVKANNIESAIENVEGALQYKARMRDAESWARAIARLGAAYREREVGKVSENLERAIDCLLSAVDLYEEAGKGAGRELVWVFTNLAWTYRTRIEGSHRLNVEQAIHYTERAITEARKHQWPLGEAMGRRELVQHLQSRAVGTRAENFETALALLDEIEEPFRASGDQRLMRMYLSSRGNCYVQRVRGSRRENLQLALRSLEQAAALTDRDKNPYDWALCQSWLGRCRRRQHGPKALRLAEQHCRDALAIFRAQKTPRAQTHVLLDLAVILLQQAETDPSLLERSLSMVEEASALVANFPRYSIAGEILRTKGQILRAEGSEANIHASVNLFEQATEILSERDYPWQWADLQHDLGLSWLHLRDDKGLESARRHLRAALRVHTREAAPHEWNLISASLDELEARHKGDSARANSDRRSKGRSGRRQNESSQSRV
jgi:tetratricopeptide (TPR) repeat protein